MSYLSLKYELLDAFFPIYQVERMLEDIVRKQWKNPKNFDFVLHYKHIPLLAGLVIIIRREGFTTWQQMIDFWMINRDARVWCATNPRLRVFPIKIDELPKFDELFSYNKFGETIDAMILDARIGQSYPKPLVPVCMAVTSTARPFIQRLVEDENLIEEEVSLL